MLVLLSGVFLTKNLNFSQNDLIFFPKAVAVEAVNKNDPRTFNLEGAGMQA